jgi:hypothetical protein
MNYFTVELFFLVYPLASRFIDLDQLDELWLRARLTLDYKHWRTKPVADLFDMQDEIVSRLAGRLLGWGMPFV